MYDLMLWLVGVVGVLVGLLLGMAYAFAITWQQARLGAKMGTQVLQAARLSAHVSREYAPVRERLDGHDREIRELRELVRKFWTGEGG